MISPVLNFDKTLRACRKHSPGAPVFFMKAINFQGIFPLGLSILNMLSNKLLKSLVCTKQNFRKYLPVTVDFLHCSSKGHEIIPALSFWCPLGHLGQETSFHQNHDHARQIHQHLGVLHQTALVCPPSMRKKNGDPGHGPCHPPSCHHHLLLMLC